MHTTYRGNVLFVRMKFAEKTRIFYILLLRSCEFMSVSSTTGHINKKMIICESLEYEGKLNWLPGRNFYFYGNLDPVSILSDVSAGSTVRPSTHTKPSTLSTRTTHTSPSTCTTSSHSTSPSEHVESTCSTPGMNLLLHLFFITVYYVSFTVRSF